ncbi:hypothetical protein LguiA_022199 [Lonicera macranthoides]
MTDRNSSFKNGNRKQILNGGQLLTLSLDQASGSGFQSKNKYLFGRIDMQLKLVPGNSAGTVTTFYLSSQGPGHDKIDFEFLGNSSGNPYTVHTNVYAKGKGDKEQQFHLWFDPTTAFHTYSIFFGGQYSHKSISQQRSNWCSMSQPMRVYSSLWNVDDWATQGGRVKADWTNAPFTASYRNFKANACVVSSGLSSCSDSKSTNSLNTEAWQTQDLDGTGRNRLRWVQKRST